MNEPVAEVVDYEARLAEMQATIEQLERNQAPREDISEIQRQLAAFQQTYDTPVPGAQQSEPCVHEYADGRRCNLSRYDHVAEGEGLRARVHDHSYRNLPLKHGP